MDELKDRSYNKTVSVTQKEEWVFRHLIENFAGSLTEPQQKLIYNLRSKLKRATKRYTALKPRKHYKKTEFNDNKIVNTSCPECNSREKNQITCHICKVDAINYCEQCGYCFNIEGFHEEAK